MRHKPIPVLSRRIFNILDMRHVCLCGLSCRFQQLSPSQGRLLMYYSPVRHSMPKHCVRLACIRHAASVHPDAGSNSPLSFSIFRQFHVFLTLSFFLSLLTCLLFSFQCPCALSSSAHL